MTRRSRSATGQLWADRIDRFEQSDQTVAQFCAQEGFSQASLYHWRRKLRPIDPAQQTSTAFVPVKLPAPLHQEPAPLTQAATTLSVELPGGVRVRLEVTRAGQDRP